MAKRAYQKVLPPKDLTIDETVKREVEIDDTAKATKDFKTLAEQIAKSTIFHRNYYVPELRERFRFIDRMKRIDKVFPYARLREGTDTVMLFVDEPKTPADVEVCAVKAKHLRAMGYAYVYIESDTTLYDALTQLGEV